jgi:adenylate cyclase class IV
MGIKNFEFKARVYNLDNYDKKLLSLDPAFHGIDEQVDTYFRVSKGRLKIREGNIENALIYYERDDVADTKKSDMILFRYAPDKALKEILTLQLGVKIIVHKIRKIYFIEHVKFHFDVVDNLGSL